MWLRFNQGYKKWYSTAAIGSPSPELHMTPKFFLEGFSTMLKDELLPADYGEDKDMGDLEDRVNYPNDKEKVLTMCIQHWNLASFTLF